jgi:trehalose/maltose hydrolase-like predicted phosphorylase
MPASIMSGRVEMDDLFEPTADPTWVLAAEGYDPLRESIYEARFTISNGFLGVRGGRVVSRGERLMEPLRTYIAGLFDVPSPDQPIPVLISAPGWLQFRIIPNGDPLVHHPTDVAGHRTMLDMRRGTLLTTGRLLDYDDKIAVRARTLRLVSLRDRAIGLHVIELQVEQGEIDVTLETSFEGLGLGLKSERLEKDLGVWRTKYSGKRLAIAAASSLQIDGSELAATMPGPFVWSWHLQAHPGQIVRFSRLVSMVRSDTPDVDPAQVVRGKLEATRQLGWRKVVQEHEAVWSERWQCSDFEVAGDPAAEQALRFAVYHLNSAANPADERVSIGARGLTGEDYHGHVFWDTEIYLLPFYTLTWPEAARSLLMYRFRTIDGARAKAAAMGWRGAMYAWESADTGAEVTPDHVVAPDGRIVDVLCGKQEQHITADVAYAVWQYWLATEDVEFLLDAGAEILLETGRFWASRAQPEADGYCHIRGIIGPDEYHEHIDDNAFTNGMARWNIRRAISVADLLRERWPERWASLSFSLGLTDAELAEWRRVADTMATGWDPQTGLFEQFAGFFKLQEIDLKAYAGRSVPIDVVLGHERTQASQVVKQADVVALIGLLPEEFPGDSAAANFRYYEPRCGHGSSLSGAMHGLVAARLGYSALALQYFQKAVAIDLSDTHTAIAGGLHMAALGGTWMTAVLGFAGLSLQSESIALGPKLPASWRSMAFAIQWRGRHLKVRIDSVENLLHARLEAGDAMPVIVNGRQYELRLKQEAACPLDGVRSESTGHGLRA